MNFSPIFNSLVHYNKLKYYTFVKPEHLSKFHWPLEVDELFIAKQFSCLKDTV